MLFPASSLLLLLSILATNKPNNPFALPSNDKLQLHQAELIGDDTEPMEPPMGWPQHLQPTVKEVYTPGTIPKYIHFIFGLDTTSKPEFGFIQYLGIVSSFVNLKPERIYFWHHVEPEGEWWDKTKPFITDLKIARNVVEIFGNPIENYAHKADILRLEILLKYGGIYLDQDTVVWRDMDSLLHHECVMGHEGEGGWVGLGNAVILSKPGSRFIKRWYQSYTNFDDSNWNYHSIVLPGRLASEHSQEIHLLDYSRFFWPLWNEKGLQKFYVEKVYEFGTMGYLNHLWESKALRFVLADTTPETIEQVDLPLFCKLRQFLRVSKPRNFKKDGSFQWKDHIDSQQDSLDPACQIFDEPLQPLLASYDFDNDTPLKLQDSTPHHLNGWFLDNKAWNNQTGLYPHFAQFPPPFNQVRFFNGSWGSYAILPTLRRRGLTFDEFSTSLWIRIDPMAALRQEKMAIMELIGDCDSYSASDKCPNLIVKLRKVPSPSNQTFVMDAVIYEMRYGDPWIIVKLARIDSWEKEHSETLKPNQWYRIQISASRQSQKLSLQVDSEHENLVKMSSPYFVPSAILPARIRSVWLGAPWRLYNNQRDFGEDFTGWMDRVAISGREEDLTQVLNSSVVIQPPAPPAPRIQVQRIHKRDFLTPKDSRKGNVVTVISILTIGSIGTKLLRRRRFANGKVFILLLLASILIVAYRRQSSSHLLKKSIIPPPLPIPDPIITVVMPCYNQAQYIQEAMDSVFEQTYTRWQLLIIDDASPDSCFETASEWIKRRWPGHRQTSSIIDTLQFNISLPKSTLQEWTWSPDCQNCPTTIRLLKNSLNVGLATSRNIALSLASSEWILTLDADDKIHPSYLYSAIHEIKVNPSLGIISGVSQQFFEGSSWIWNLPPWSPRQVLERGPFPVATFFRKSDWYRVGGYNPFLPWGNEDWTFWIALSWLPGMQVRLIALDPVIAGKNLKSKTSFTYYRFKQASMAREKEQHQEECEAMMKTLHPHPFGPEKIVETHNTLIQALTEPTIQRVEKSLELYQGNIVPEVALWMGLWWENRSLKKMDTLTSLTKARQWYLNGLHQDSWQLYWRLGVVQNKIQKMEEKLVGDPQIQKNVMLKGKVWKGSQLCEEALKLAGLFLYGKMGECINPL